MRLRALAAALLATLALGAAPAREFQELPPGRYSLSLSGLLCAVCARAVAAEWAKLPEIEAVSIEYEKPRATITVRLDRTLKVATLRKALRRAEKLANLGVHFEVHDIVYRVDSGSRN